MSRLPRVSGREVVSALKKIHYEQDRQKGGHSVMRQIDYPHGRVVVPDHKEIAKGTFTKSLRQAGLSVEQFRRLL